MEKKMFDIKKAGDVTILKMLCEEITLDDNERLKEIFEATVKEGAKKIILDLSGLKFISSIVLASLVFIKHKIRDVGGSLRIIGLSGRVKDVFDMTDLHKIFDIYETETEALESFTKG